jgi:hypothetical protein
MQSIEKGAAGAGGGGTQDSFGPHDKKVKRGLHHPPPHPTPHTPLNPGFWGPTLLDTVI